LGYPYYGGYYYPGYYATTYPDYDVYSPDYSTYSTAADVPMTEAAAGGPQVASTVSDSEQGMTAAGEAGEAGEADEQWLGQAESAFRERDYPNAARLAAHATIDSPRNAKAHEIASLALFAEGQFRGAAMEAHAALALGPAADWNTLYSYYNDLPTYQQQLSALEKFISKNPNSPDGHFLLGYHDLMMGHREAARDQFAQVVKEVPKDKIAQQALKETQGNEGQTPTTASKAQPAR
jgi:tetratricopeptide (TPR) repeat protein